MTHVTFDLCRAMLEASRHPRIPCPSCEDGKVYTSRYGGNDPYTTERQCPECHGLGMIVQEEEE